MEEHFPQTFKDFWNPIIMTKKICWALFPCSSVQISSIQDGIYVTILCAWKSPQAPACFSEVSLTLPLKWFQCPSDWRQPSPILSRKRVLKCLKMTANMRIKPWWTYKTKQKINNKTKQTLTSSQISRSSGPKKASICGKPETSSRLTVITNKVVTTKQVIWNQFQFDNADGQHHYRLQVAKLQREILKQFYFWPAAMLSRYCY